MEKKHIIVVEDDQDLASLVSEYLTNQGFTISIIDNGIDAVPEIIEKQPALVILDLNLPGRDGFSVCRAVRNQYPGPLLMLTASNEAIDQIVGLELGADDYVNKPVEPRILLARIRALLRRSEEHEYNKLDKQKLTDISNQASNESASPANAASPANGFMPAPINNNPTSSDNITQNADMLAAGEININTANRVVYLQGNEIDLSTPEYELILILVKNSGTIVSRNALFEQMKGYEYDGISRFVDIIISQLRHKLSDTRATIIKTIRGKGYLLIK